MSQTPRTDALLRNSMNSNDLRAWQSLAVELERALSDEQKRADSDNTQMLAMFLAVEAAYECLYPQCRDIKAAIEFLRGVLDGATCADGVSKLKASGEYAGQCCALLRDARAHVAESLDDIIDTEDRDIIQKLLDDIDAALSINSTDQRDAASREVAPMNSGPRPDSSLTDSASASHQQAPLGVFPHIREWHRGAPNSIVINFAGDLTNAQIDALPKLLVRAIQGEEA